jgi:hypothetical protein
VSLYFNNRAAAGQELCSDRRDGGKAKKVCTQKTAIAFLPFII